MVAKLIIYSIILKVIITDKTRQMKTKDQKKLFQKRLCAYRKEYLKVKARIQKIGFICEGSLVERWMTCGNPECICHKDCNKRHGPYYQLSWKKEGKTITRLLSKEKAYFYQEWINNRREIVAIINKMKLISAKAEKCIVTIETPKILSTKAFAKTKLPQK